MGNRSAGLHPRLAHRKRRGRRPAHRRHSRRPQSHRHPDAAIHALVSKISETIMGKKLDKLVARIQALEKAIAAIMTGKKAKKSAKKKSAKAKTAKAPPKKTKAKKRRTK